MEKYIAFEHITQTHLVILAEYQKKNQSLATCARNAHLKLKDFKGQLITALFLAGEIAFYIEPKHKIRKKLEHFFERWYAENHVPKAEPSPVTNPELPPRIRACNTPNVHDPEITQRQMDALKQYVTQVNVIRAAEAMKLTREKYKRELALGIYRAAIVCKRSHPISITRLCKSELQRLVYEYFDALEDAQSTSVPSVITMDDPAF